MILEVRRRFLRPRGREDDGTSSLADGLGRFRPLAAALAAFT